METSTKLRNNAIHSIAANKINEQDQITLAAFILHNLNMISLSEYAQINKISYNGAKQRVKANNCLHLTFNNKILLVK